MAKPRRGGAQGGKSKNARRALSHVGGEVTVKGDRSAGRALTRAFAVELDRDEARRHIHGFHSYPARLHPTLARNFIDVFSPEGVLDPFCGSGTVLVEARLGGRTCWGYDINPLATRIARLKTRGATASELRRIRDDAHSIVQLAQQRRRNKAGATRSYPQQDRDLFAPHVLLELDSLRLGIESLSPGFPTEALWLVLSSMLTKVSHQRGDTGQLDVHRISSGFAIEFFEKRTDEMCRQIRLFTKKLPSKTPAAQIITADARDMPDLPEGKATLLLCSPPYPGNYDYVKHHEARLRWLGLPAAQFAEEEIGARRHLDLLTPDQARDHFQRDITQVLRSSKPALRPGGLAVLVIADSVAAGEAVWADPLIKQAAATAGYRWLATASQQRPHFHQATKRAFKGRPRNEHAILLQASGG